MMKALLLLIVFALVCAFEASAAIVVGQGSRDEMRQQLLEKKRLKHNKYLEELERSEAQSLRVSSIPGYSGSEEVNRLARRRLNAKQHVGARERPDTVAASSGATKESGRVEVSVQRTMLRRRLALLVEKVARASTDGADTETLLEIEEQLAAVRRQLRVLDTDALKNRPTVTEDAAESETSVSDTDEGDGKVEVEAAAATARRPMKKRRKRAAERDSLGDLAETSGAQTPYQSDEL